MAMYERRVNKKDVERLRDIQGNPLYWKLLLRVHQKALREILRKEEEARKAIGQQDSGTCTGEYSQQVGLPCSHTITQRLLWNEPLEDYPWQFERSTSLTEDELAERQIQDPRIKPGSSEQ
ncbi:hypothetical protein V1505DRAFT_354452 [Lipomyces doorenjongii]